MQDRYVPSLSDKLLEGAFDVLVSPYVLAKMGLPSNWVFSLSKNLLLSFSLNVALTGLFLFVTCMSFNAWKSRSRKGNFTG